jgi:hypothetical protein
MTLQEVKEQLGHSTIVLTSDTYGHRLDGAERTDKTDRERVAWERAWCRPQAQEWARQA